MITFNFYDYKRKHFEASDILEKEKTLRNMLKPNTWKELEYVTTTDLKLSSTILNVIICLLVPISQLSKKIMNDFLKDVIKETGNEYIGIVSEHVDTWRCRRFY